MWRNRNNNKREERGTEGPVLRDPQAARLRDGPYSSKRDDTGRGRGSFNNRSQNRGGSTNNRDQNYGSRNNDRDQNYDDWNNDRDRHNGDWNNDRDQNNGDWNFNRDDGFENGNQQQMNIWGDSQQNLGNLGPGLLGDPFPQSMEHAQFPTVTLAANTMPFFQQQMEPPPPPPPLLQSIEFAFPEQQQRPPSLFQLFQQQQQQEQQPPLFQPPPPPVPQPPYHQQSQNIPSLFSQGLLSGETVPNPIMSLVTGRANSQTASNEEPPQHYSENSGYDDNEPPWYSEFASELPQRQNQGKGGNPFTWELPSTSRISESESNKRDSPWYSELMPDNERDKTPKWELKCDEIRMKKPYDRPPPVAPKVPEIVANPLFNSQPPQGYKKATEEPPIKLSFQRDNQVNKIERNPHPSSSSFMKKSESAIPPLMSFPGRDSNSSDRLETKNPFNNHNEQNSHRELSSSWDNNSGIRTGGYGGRTFDDTPELEEEQYPPAFNMQSTFQPPTFDRERQQKPPVINRLMNLAQQRDSGSSSPGGAQRGGGWQGRGRGGTTVGVAHQRGGGGPSRGMWRQGWNGGGSNQEMGSQDWGGGESNQEMGSQDWGGRGSNEETDYQGWGGGGGGGGPNRGNMSGGRPNRGMGRGGGGPNRGIGGQSRGGGGPDRGMGPQGRGGGWSNRGRGGAGGMSGRGAGMTRGGRGGGMTGSRQEAFSDQNANAHNKRNNGPLLPTPAPKLIPYPPPPRAPPVERNPRGILKPGSKYENFVGEGFIDYSPEKKFGVVSYEDEDDDEIETIEYSADPGGEYSGNQNDNHHDFFSTKMVQHFALLLKGKSVEDQLEDLLTYILLAPEFLTTRVGIVRNLHLMLTEKYNKCKLHPYGADFIGIGSSDDSVNIFVDLTGKQGSSAYITPANIEPSELTKEAVDELLQHIQTGENHTFFGQIVKRTNYGRINLPVISFIHSESKVRCNIRLENYFLVQEAKVIQFLNSLDTRVSPMLAIIRYWSSVHRVLDTPEEDTRNRFITLLVLFFLQQKKIIPTMAELQSLSVKPEYFENVDIGFCGDFSLVPRNENSVLEDKNIFTLSILSLLKTFFNLFATANLKDNVVSLWKSEFIPKDNFLPNLEGKLLPPDLRKRYRYGVNGRLRERRLDCASKLCIQDFQDLTENLSLAVPDYDVSKFQIECELAKERLENLMINGTGCMMDLFVVTDYNTA